MRQLLPLLACPAMMGAMMLMMRRRDHRTADPETTALREEAAELRRTLEQGVRQQPAPDEPSAPR